MAIPSGVYAGRPDSLTMANYFPDGQSSEQSLSGLVTQCRSVFELGLCAVVVDVSSESSRALYDEVVDSGLVRGGDSVTLLAPHQSIQKNSFKFGDLIWGEADGIKMRVRRWLDKQERQHLLTRTFDVVIYPGEQSEEAVVIRALSRHASLSMVGLANYATHNEVSRQIANEIGPNQPVFGKALGDDRCVPLVSL